MSLLGGKVFKYILKISLRFTECCYEIICLYQLDAVLHQDGKNEQVFHLIKCLRMHVRPNPGCARVQKAVQGLQNRCLVRKNLE